MEKTKVSDKYQVVIPRAIRDIVKIKEGQTLSAYALSDGSVLLSPEKKWPDDYIGTEKEIWNKIDVAKYIDEERNSWE